MTSRDATPRSSLFVAMLVALGPVFIWALHFGATYAAQHTACSMGIAESVVVLVAATTFAALAGILILRMVVRQKRNGQAEAVDQNSVTRFVDRVGQLLSVLASVAILWAGTAVLILPPCETLR